MTKNLKADALGLVEQKERSRLVGDASEEPHQPWTSCLQLLDM